MTAPGASPLDGPATVTAVDPLWRTGSVARLPLGSGVMLAEGNLRAEGRPPVPPLTRLLTWALRVLLHAHDHPQTAAIGRWLALEPPEYAWVGASVRRAPRAASGDGR